MSERTPIVEHDGMPHYEDINTPLIFMLTVIAAIVTYACVAAITGLYHQMKREQQALINAETVTMSAQIIADQKANLSKGDSENKIVPIGEAMKATVEQLGGEWKSEADHSHVDHHDGAAHDDHAHDDEAEHGDEGHGDESHGDEDTDGEAEHN